MISAVVSLLAMVLSAVICWQLAPVAIWVWRRGTAISTQRDLLIASGAVLWLAALVGTMIRFWSLVLVPEWGPPPWLSDGVMVAVIVAAIAVLVAMRSDG